MVAAMMFAACGTDDENKGYFTYGEWVDLGLPSGLLWYSCNLGATGPEGYGYYYAWGETQPKSIYDWSTYRYCNGDIVNLTKYCNDSGYGHNGFTDGNTTLEAMDDVATHDLKNDARIPRKEEWQELLDHTTSKWEVQNGVYGRRFMGENGNALFLPAAGSYSDGELSGEGEIGNYWSASLCEDFPNSALYFYFYAGSQFVGASGRSNGLSIRPVRSTR